MAGAAVGGTVSIILKSKIMNIRITQLSLFDEPAPAMLGGGLLAVWTT